MAPLTSKQKADMQQFIGVTNLDKKQAEKVLKNHNWGLDAAVNAYYNQAPPAAASSKTETALNKMFDKYRDDPTNSPHTIQMSGAAPYFADLGINMSDPDISLLLISELLQCPSLGDIPRANFLAAWSPFNSTTVAAQTTHLRQLGGRLGMPEERGQGGLFRRVYKHTFKVACPAGSKSVPLEQAIEFWRHLFGVKGMMWVTGSDGRSQAKHAGDKVDWFTLYTTFLSTHWKKAVNRDLWDQTLLFALRTVEDPSLGWWNEEQAWPGVVDEFVAWMGDGRPGKGESGGGGGGGIGAGRGDAMDVS